jgi:hypothetical protein
MFASGKPFSAYSFYSVSFGELGHNQGLQNSAVLRKRGDLLGEGMQMLNDLMKMGCVVGCDNSSFLVDEANNAVR